MLHLGQVGLKVSDRVGVGKARPQPLALASGVIAIEPGIRLLAQTPSVGHGKQNPIHRRVRIGIAHRGLCRLGNLHAQIDRGFIDQLQRPQRHAHQLCGIFNQRRFHTFGDHADAFVDIGNDAAVGVEEAGIVDDDGRLADLAHEIQRLCHCAIPRGLAPDDLDQHHLVDRREEMDADELLGPLAGLGQTTDRQGRGIGGKDAVGSNGGLDAGRHLGLHLGVFEHRFHDQVAAGKGGMLGGGQNAPQHLGLLLGRHFPALNALVEQVFGMGTAPVGRLLRGIDQYHVNPGIGGNIGDARPHHACANHTKLAHRLIRLRRANCPFFQCFLVDEQRPDHRPGGRVQQHAGEPARLDPQGSVERDKRAFIDSRQQRLGRRINTHRLAQHHGTRPDEGHEPRRLIGGAARHLVALGIPGFHQIGIGCGQDPLLGPCQQRLGGDNLVNQAGGLCRLRVAQLAFQQEGGGSQRPHLAHQPCRAARAGENADHDLGQADLCLWIVGGNDAVAGQRQFQTNAKGGSRQGRDNRLAALQGLGIHPGAFDPAQDAVNARDAVEDALRAVLLHPRDDVQVHAPGKVLFRRSQDDAFYRRIGQRLAHQRIQQGEAFGGHHVHRFARHVPGQGGHAIGIGCQGKIRHHKCPFTAPWRRAGAASWIRATAVIWPPVCHHRASSCGQGHPCDRRGHGRGNERYRPGCGCRRSDRWHRRRTGFPDNARWAPRQARRRHRP